MIPELLPPSIECSPAYHLPMTGATTGGTGFRRWSRQSTQSRTVRDTVSTVRARPSRIETAKRATTMIVIAVDPRTARSHGSARGSTGGISSKWSHGRRGVSSGRSVTARRTPTRTPTGLSARTLQQHTESRSTCPPNTRRPKLARAGTQERRGRALKNRRGQPREGSTPCPGTLVDKGFRSMRPLS